MTELTSSLRPLSNEEIAARAQASRTRAQERAEQRRKPSKIKKIGQTALILTVTAAAATGIGLGAKAAAQGLYDKVLAGPQLERELSQPIGQVKAELKTGDINPNDVAEVKVDESQSTWGEAIELTGGDHAIGPVASIIEKQVGDSVAQGQELVLPPGSIDTPAAAGPK